MHSGQLYEAHSGNLPLKSCHEPSTTVETCRMPRRKSCTAEVVHGISLHCGHSAGALMACSHLCMDPDEHTPAVLLPLCSAACQSALTLPTTATQALNAIERVANSTSSLRLRCFCLNQTRLSTSLPANGNARVICSYGRCSSRVLS